MKKRLFLSMAIILLIILHSVPAPAGTEPIRRIEVGWGTVDNTLGAIYFDRNVRDHFRYLKLNFGQYHDTGPGTSFRWLLELDHRLFAGWDWSDLIIPGIRLQWSKKSGIGPRAPRVSAWLRYQYLNYGADGCNGPLFNGGLDWTRRLSPRFALGLGWDIDRRRTTGSSAYDLDGQSVRLTGHWELSPRLQASATAGQRRGDVSIHDLDNWSPAGIRWYPSRLLGIPQRIYTLADLTSDFFILELIWHHNRNTSTRLNWRRDKARSRWQDYQRDQVELGVIHRF